MRGDSVVWAILVADQYDSVVSEHLRCSCLASHFFGALLLYLDLGICADQVWTWSFEFV